MNNRRLRFLVYLQNFDLNTVHFCRTSKAKYRVHLTMGIVIGTVASVAGVVFDMLWLTHLATATNAITALIWIWE